MSPSDRAVELVIEYIYKNESAVEADSIKLVWFCKTLKNWKALVADISEDGKFFEVTYSGEFNDTNIDVYAKISSVRVKDQ